MDSVTHTLTRIRLAITVDEIGEAQLYMVITLDNAAKSDKI